MYYIVDGYNLLFRISFSTTSSLNEARTRLIQELDRLATLLSLHLTIVFDAPMQTEELRRSHFNSLEIIFTAKSETADDYIRSFLSMQTDSNRLTLVTSDKTLARTVRSRVFEVQSVEDFIHFLRKRAVKKEINSLKKKKETQALKKKSIKDFSLTENLKKESNEQKTPEGKKIKTKGLPPLSDVDQWEKLFLEHLKELKKEK